MFGSIFGCASIWSMTMIAFDRYNVIVKGLSAKPMTNGGAILRIFFVWAHAALWTILPMVGWNRYVPEGNMTACGTDYLTKDWFSRSYIIVYGFFVYFLPLLLIIYSYWFIVQVHINLKINRSCKQSNLNISSRSTPRYNLGYLLYPNIYFLLISIRLYQLTRRICANKLRK